MSNPPIRLTRDQLAAFVPNQRVLRALEQLLLNQSDDSSDIVGDFLTAYIEASNASAAANNAIALIESRFAEIAGMMPPRVEVAQDVYPLPPVVNIIADVDIPPPSSENRSPSIDYIDLNTLTESTDVVGRFRWNLDEDTADLVAMGNTYQVGQELSILCKNQTGSDIINGTPLMLSGTLGASGRLLIRLAIADGTYPAEYVLGLATEDILNGDDGKVTWYGKIRHIDTTGSTYGEVWADGDVLYISETTAGYLTKTPPQAPNLRIPVAAVVHAAANGVLMCRPAWTSRFVDLDDVNGTPLTTDGQIPVWDQTNSYFDFTANINDKAPAYNGLLDGSLFSVTYTPATRVYEVVVSSDTYAWANGTRVFIAADTYTMDAHSDTTGVYYLLIGEDGTIHVNSTFEFLDHAIISYAYYNATTNKGVAFDERHPADKIGWPASIHSYHHFNEGAKLRSGGTVSGFTLTSNANADMQVDIAETIFDDESYQNTCAPLTGADGVYTLWYRSGADVDGEWDWTTGANLPIVVSTNNPTYNLLSGGNWSNSAITNNSRWVNVWLIATNSLESDHRFVFIQGQALHTTLAAAEAESFLTAISWGKLPFAEIVPLARITFRRATGTGNNFYIDEVTSIRGTQASVTSTVSPTVHNTLSGRSDPGSHPATAITYEDTTVDAALTARELLANKETALTDSDTKYPSSSAVLDGIALQVNPKQFSQAVALTAAISGTNGIRVADNDNIDMLTNNFCVSATIAAADYTPTAKNYVVSKMNSTDTAGFIFNLEETTGKLRIMASFSGSMVSFVSTAAPMFTDGCWYDVSAVITRETASVAGSIAFYIDGRHFETVVIPAAAPSSLATDQPMFIAGLKDRRVGSAQSRVLMLNFAPTAAQMLDMHRNGIPEAWKWGSQATLNLNSLANGPAETAYPTFEGASSSGVRVVSDGSTTHVCGTSDEIPLFNGKEYAIDFDITVSSGSGPTSILLRNALAGITYASFSTTPIISGRYTINAVSTATTTGVVEFRNASAAGDWTLSNFTVKQVGAVLALEPEGIQPSPGQWLDASTNKLHAMQPEAGSSLTRPQRTFEVRWTNTWAGTHEAQYIGGVNQNVLPPNAYIESILGTVSGATVEDIIIGDGSDNDRWVAITTGLAAGTTSFTLANRISDGTNRKLVVDPDANATMSIVWTIKGYILEA